MDRDELLGRALTLADEEDAFPPRDLAGNTVGTLPAARLTVDAAQATQRNGGRVSRYTSLDEERNDGLPEWGGQLLGDALRQLIRPRPIIRSQVVIDDDQPIVAQMTQFPAGVVTPLSQFGSKMQTVWQVFSSDRDYRISCRKLLSGLRSKSPFPSSSPTSQLGQPTMGSSRGATFMIVTISSRR